MNRFAYFSTKCLSGLSTTAVFKSIGEVSRCPSLVTVRVRLQRTIPGVAQDVVGGKTGWAWEWGSVKIYTWRGVGREA